MNTIDWGAYLPRRDLPHTGLKAFAPGQIWACCWQGISCVFRVNVVDPRGSNGQWLETTILVKSASAEGRLRGSFSNTEYTSRTVLISEDGKTIPPPSRMQELYKTVGDLKPEQAAKAAARKPLVEPATYASLMADALKADGLPAPAKTPTCRTCGRPAAVVNQRGDCAACYAKDDAAMFTRMVVDGHTTEPEPSVNDRWYGNVDERDLLPGPDDFGTPRPR